MKLSGARILQFLRRTRISAVTHNTSMCWEREELAASGLIAAASGLIAAVSGLIAAASGLIAAASGLI
ncbi:hypothetical protein Pcinc_029099 [Petrolisthes cinctipes]|uniref:Uncharacterized protein n=1 Tax=Petrolisthes cinctipes TaxID=88211 RepID=A0AAE1F1M2_PETCI|nr:hypothetical protein Pcinc_029099 [Petrolisthes cinctipes]